MIEQRVARPVGIASPRQTAAWPRLVKDASDRLLALLLLAVALPLLAVAALLIALTDPGPVLFRQERVGRDGRVFHMWKLRTMRRGARDGQPEPAKLPDDPRVSPVGRLLRRSSLDELPQLLNVLCGSMSLVGPRPRLPEEMRLPGAAPGDLAAKPGMTGLWQVSGRAELPWEERLRLDRAYLERWSLGLDARILARTVRAVLSARGAY